MIFLVCYNLIAVHSFLSVGHTTAYLHIQNEFQNNWQTYTNSFSSRTILNRFFRQQCKEVMRTLHIIMNTYDYCNTHS